MYVAVILFPHYIRKHECNTLAEAERWLDEENPEKQFATFIEETDSNGNIIDGFAYTEKKK